MLANDSSLLREIVPTLRQLAILASAGTPVTLLDMREVGAAAGTLGLTVVTVEIRHQPDSHQYLGRRATADNAQV